MHSTCYTFFLLNYYVNDILKNNWTCVSFVSADSYVIGGAPQDKSAAKRVCSFIIIVPIASSLVQAVGVGGFWICILKLIIVT